MLDFMDELFTKYGNTSNYYLVRKPLEPKKSSLHKEPLDPSEKAFLKRTTKELVSIISNEWLEESELSSDVIRLDSPSISIHCQIHKGPFKALYNPVMGVNIMSASFATNLLRHMPLTSTTKLLKSPSGHNVPSLGILYVLPIQVKGTMVHLNFYIFDIIEFDLLIGQPMEKLIQEGQTGKLNFCLGKNFKLPLSITHSLNAKTEPCPEPDPIEEDKVASLEHLIKPNLEEDVEFFIEEEDDGPLEPEPLNELLEPPKPPIELKPLSVGLGYAFLNNDQESPVIISDKLSPKETLRLITVLEKHRSAFGYSLQDLKGISPALCTHRIPIDPETIPSRKPQRRLNNAMREIVKKEVLKLLYAGIIYPVSYSEWVSPVQIVPKKGGMTVIKNEKNELIPQRTVTRWQMCIDYRKLNKATKKDHFPLPFIDEMLERLANHSFFYFLDGYS
jgi:hypothetical protein